MTNSPDALDAYDRLKDAFDVWLLKAAESRARDRGRTETIAEDFEVEVTRVSGVTLARKAMRQA